MVHIDHLSYPHIIDSIWASFSLRDLSIARRVCQSWRSRADAILAKLVRHLSLDFRHGASLGQPDRVGLSVRDTHDTPGMRALISVLYFTDGTASGIRKLQPLNEPWHSLFAAGQVEVVDLIGFPDFRPSYLPELFGAESDVGAGGDWEPSAKPVVRWYNTYPSCQEAIAYTPLGPDTPVYFLDLRPGLPLPTIHVPNERQPRNLIVSIDCYTDPTTPILNKGPAFDVAPPMVTDDGEMQQNLSTVTVILNDKRSRGDRIEQGGTVDHGLLFNYVQMLYGLRDMLCVVGLDAFLDEDALQRYRNNLGKELLDCYRKATGTSPYDDVDPDNPPAELNLMTLEEFKEWRAIGREKYEKYNVR